MKKEKLTEFPDVDKHVTAKKDVDVLNLYLPNMNTSVNPCEDFFEFVCGKYPQNHPIPDYQIEVTYLSTLTEFVELKIKQYLEQVEMENEPRHFKILKKYYNACMNTELIENTGLHEIKNIVEDLGGWSVANNTEANTQWTSLYYKLNNLGLAQNYIFSFLPYIGYSKNYLLILDPLFETKSQIDHNNRKPVKEQNVDYMFMIEVATMFGVNLEEAKLLMTEVLNFQEKLSDIKFPESLVSYTTEELQSNFPKINWYDLIINTSGIVYKILANANFIDTTIELLEETPQRTIHNYLIWRGILDMMPYLDETLNSLYKKHLNILQPDSPQLSPLPRWKFCLANNNKNLLFIQNALYVRNFFHKEYKNIIMELIRYIKEDFIHVVNSTIWEETDKGAAINIIQSIAFQISSPSELLDDQKLDEIYRTVEIDEKDYLRSSLNLLKLQPDNEWYLCLLGKENKSYALTDTEVNAYYHPSFNYITIPAAILQGIFFNPIRPSSQNFGSIGYIIAHEISHAIGSTSVSGMTEFDLTERTNCLVKQFNEYAINGTHLNGSLLINENLSDLNGLNIAYHSYKRWVKDNGEEPGMANMNYTNNQLFWIAAATPWCDNLDPRFISYRILDPHPVGFARINGIYQNLDSFSNDFYCPVGSKMNPEKKCRPF